MENILSLLIWLPILGAIVVAFIPRDKEDIIRYTSAAFTGLQFIVAIQLWRKFEPENGGMQFMERLDWIPSLNISYILGVDGLSLPMVLLTAMLFFIGVFVSWNINKAVKGYFALYLLLDAGVVGVFLSLDFFLFYIFLGGNVTSDVFPHWYVGRTTKGICCDQIFSFIRFLDLFLMLVGILGLVFTCEKTFDNLFLWREH
jgi:NADH:ubiquinone oxidoreductase subunit 4 (chain M)